MITLLTKIIKCLEFRSWTFASQRYSPHKILHLLRILILLTNLVWGQTKTRYKRTFQIYQQLLKWQLTVKRRLRAALVETFWTVQEVRCQHLMNHQAWMLLLEQLCIPIFLFKEGLSQLRQQVTSTRLLIRRCLLTSTHQKALHTVVTFHHS